MFMLKREKKTSRLYVGYKKKVRMGTMKKSILTCVRERNVATACVRCDDQTRRVAEVLVVVPVLHVAYTGLTLVVVCHN